MSDGRPSDNAVVYTAIFDDYDVLLDPREVNDDVDYVCFTDDPELSSDVWEPVTIDEDLEPGLKNRKVKLLPHRYLPEYDYSVYVDGNVQLIGDVTELLDEHLEDHDFACPRHHEHICVYREAEAIVEQGKADAAEVRRQVDRYREAGFPENYGLSEHNLLLRRHIDPAVKELMEAWWEEYTNGVGRDQLGLPYVAWKRGYEYELIDENPRLPSVYFRLHTHDPPGVRNLFWSAYPDGIRGRIWELWIRSRARRDVDTRYAALYYPIRAVKKFREDGLTHLLRDALHKFLPNRIRDPLFTLADSHGLIGADFIYQGYYYRKRRSDPHRSEANEIAVTFDQEFDPDSVIDFGCAIGAYLEPFHEAGCTVKGIEGNRDAFKYAVVPTEHLEYHDLRRPYEAERAYDLVMSIEVAEHIPERFADTFVDTLVNAGETVVMTAAIEGQGGQHHVNEQPRSYWKGKFAERGLVYDGEAVERIRHRLDVDTFAHVPENLFVFRNPSPEGEDD